MSRQGRDWEWEGRRELGFERSGHLQDKVRRPMGIFVRSGGEKHQTERKWRKGIPAV